MAGSADFLLMHKGKYVPRKEWLLTIEDKERALAMRQVTKQEELTRITKPLESVTVVPYQTTHGHVTRWGWWLSPWASHSTR